MLFVLAALATFFYALVNAFGAWMVSRRKVWVALLFMGAASLLIIAFAAMIGLFSYTRLILAAGLILASLASLINAQIVLGRVVWRFHLFRAIAGLLIYTLAHFGMR